MSKFVIVRIQEKIQVLRISRHMQEDGKGDEEVHLPREGDTDLPFDEIRDTGQEKTDECGEGDTGVENDEAIYPFQKDEALHGPGDVDSAGGRHFNRMFAAGRYNGSNQ